MPSSLIWERELWIWSSTKRSLWRVFWSVFSFFSGLISGRWAGIFIDPVSRLLCTFRIWQQTSAPTISPFFQGVLWKYSRLPWCVKKNVCSLLGRKITLKFLFSSSKENSLKIPGYGFLGSVKKSSSNWKNPSLSIIETFILQAHPIIIRTILPFSQNFVGLLRILVRFGIGILWNFLRLHEQKKQLNEQTKKKVD